AVRLVEVFRRLAKGRGAHYWYYYQNLNTSKCSFVQYSHFTFVFCFFQLKKSIERGIFVAVR
uniref:Strictosidine synthase conserved region domain-containing protein n=1 Tax=Parascaris univalens TaxID=6257 RepID=A0A914ZJQ1_PARUN